MMKPIKLLAPLLLLVLGACVDYADPSGTWDLADEESGAAVGVLTIGPPAPGAPLCCDEVTGTLDLADRRLEVAGTVHTTSFSMDERACHSASDACETDRLYEVHGSDPSFRRRFRGTILVWTFQDGVRSDPDSIPIVGTKR